MQDFTTLLRRLTEESLEFVIVGGFAAVTHGSAYVTRDVDICAVLTAEKALGREKDLLTAKELRAIAAKRHPT